MLTGAALSSVPVGTFSASTDISPEGFAGGRAAYEMRGAARIGGSASTFVRSLEKVWGGTYGWCRWVFIGLVMTELRLSWYGVLGPYGGRSMGSFEGD